MNKNRIVIFGWANSIHVQRWCVGLKQRGYSIKLISAADGPTDLVETLILPRRGKLSYLTNLSLARKEALKFSPDLIHVHYVAGNGLLGMWTKIHPMVSSVWGSDIDTKGNRWPVNRIVKAVLKDSDHITATSNFLKAQTEKILKDEKRPISIIPFGVEIPAEVSSMPPSRPFKICYLKDHKPVYGADILIKAMSQAVKAGAEVSLTIAGKENEYTRHLKKLVAEYNLTGQVSFAGLIDHERVNSFLSIHHVLVMPSRSEGFGVAALEASANGRPVIASRVGGIPEIVRDGKTGVLAPENNPKALAEAILKLANNVELCDKMGRDGREFVRQNYQWEKSLNSMCELYERLIYESRQAQN